MSLCQLNRDLRIAYIAPPLNPFDDGVEKAIGSGDGVMRELTLTLPEDLYDNLQAAAASKGTSLEALILERLSIEATPKKERETENRLLHEVLYATGLLQPVSPDLLSDYVSEPSAPRHTPIRVSGKPLSALIIEQRDFSP